MKFDAVNISVLKKWHQEKSRNRIRGKFIGLI